MPQQRNTKTRGAFSTLFKNGFTEDLISVIPPGVELMPGSAITPDILGKVPGRKMTTGAWQGGWTRIRTLQDAERMDTWGANVGVETTRLIPIDFDVNATRLHAPLLALAKARWPLAPVRMGKRPMVLLRLKGPCQLGRYRVKFVTKDDGEEHLIEVFFGPYKQFVLHGQHPSGAQYACNPTVDKLRFDSIPEATETEIRAFLKHVTAQLDTPAFGCTAGKAEYDNARAAYSNEPDNASIIAPLPFVANALRQIPNTTGRDRWIDICHAVKGATQEHPEAGKRLWLDWCGTREDGAPHLAEADRVWTHAGEQDKRIWIGYEALLMLGGLSNEQAKNDFANAPLPDLPDGTPAPVAFTVQPVQLRPLLRPAWTVRNMLQGNAALGVLYGAPGSNKSTLATALAVHIALGLPFAGQPTKQGAVLMISEEDAIDNRRRVAAWEQWCATLDDKSRLPADWQRMIHGNILETYPGFGHMSKKKVALTIRETLKATAGAGVRLVVLDTLARTFIENGEENEANAMTKYIDMAESLAAGLNCPVIIVHHPPKNADTLRGHSSLLGAVSMVWKTERDPTDGIVRLYCQKMRSAPEFAPLAFERKAIDISFAVGRTDDGDDEAISALILEQVDWTDTLPAATSEAGQRRQQAARNREHAIRNDFADGQQPAQEEQGRRGRTSRITDLDILRAMEGMPGASMRNLTDLLGFSSHATLARRMRSLHDLGLVGMRDGTWHITEQGQAMHAQATDGGGLLG